MEIFSIVSETALITLKSRAVESSNKSKLIDDPKSCELVEKLSGLDLSDSQRRIIDTDPPRSLSSYAALRARKFDSYSIAFLLANPEGAVVSLGAGFDTRYWRIPVAKERYIEVDLPPVVEVKKELLGYELNYTIIGDSVLESSWMEQVAARQTDHILFLAEGLFMYLPEEQVIGVFKDLAKRFSRSEIVVEVVNKKYTKGFRKKMMESKMKRRGGSEAGSSFSYGMTAGKEIESYDSNYRLLEEWSYFEEEDVRPKMLRYLKNMKTFSRTLWTVRAAIDRNST